MARGVSLALFFLAGVSCGGQGTNGERRSAEILYTSSWISREIHAFELDAARTGLTLLPDFPLTNIDVWPNRIAVHPNGRWLYLPSGDDILLFEISGSGRSIRPAPHPAWDSPGEQKWDILFSDRGTLALVTVYNPAAAPSVDRVLVRVSPESGVLSVLRRGNKFGTLGFTTGGRFVVEWSDGVLSSHLVDDSQGSWGEQATDSLQVSGAPQLTMADNVVKFVVAERVDPPTAARQEQFSLVTVDPETGRVRVGAGAEIGGYYDREAFDPLLRYFWRVRNAEASTWRIERDSVRFVPPAVPAGSTFIFYSRSAALLFSGFSDSFCVRTGCTGSPGKVYAYTVDPSTGALRPVGAPAVAGIGLIGAARLPR